MGVKTPPVASIEGRTTMPRPYALLRVGFTYDRTLGMRRLTNTPVDLAVGKDGDLQILCRGGVSFIRRLSQDDEDLGAINLAAGGAAQIGGTYSVNSKFVWPISMQMDGDENLWISDEGTNLITVIDQRGEMQAQWGKPGCGEGEFNRQSGIALDADENVYVCDTLNHRVQKFTRDGEFLTQFGGHGKGDGEFDMPWGICVDELGDVYVADWRNDRVQKFTADGEFLFKIGKSGDGEGEFNRPTGVAVDEDGDIYVTDWANDRVQLFRPDGAFVELFRGDATLSKQAHHYMKSNVKALRLREMASLEPQKRLRWPVSARVYGKTMYIADYGSDRIQIYQKEAYPLEPHEISEPQDSPTLYTQF